MSLFGLATGLATKTAANAAKKAASNTVKKSSSKSSSSSAATSANTPAAATATNTPQSSFGASGYTGGMASTLANMAADTSKLAQQAYAAKKKQMLGYDPDLDYADAIKQATASGASAQEIKSLWDERDKKIEAMGLSPSYYNDEWTTANKAANASLLRQQQAWQEQVDSYNKMREDADALTRAQIEQGKLQLQQQLPTINQNYEDAARQAYIQYMQNRKELPEQLARQGIGAGGASESAMVSLANNYGQALSSAKNAQTQAVNELNNSIANLEASGNLQAAQNAYNIALQQAQAQQTALQQQQALEQQAYQNMFGYGQAVGSLGGTPTLDYLNAQNQWNYNNTSLNQNQQQIDQSNQQIANAYQQQKWQNALDLWAQMGTANAAVAAILGVPVGTPTSDWRYTQAQIGALNRK